MQPDDKMMGFSTPGDQKVPIAVRDWNGLRLALWRSRVGWEIAVRQAVEIMGRCGHMEGCAGREDEILPCMQDCPDREIRMSALVVLNAARMFAPIDARRAANDPYMAPSREYFSEMIAALAAAQAENSALRAMLSAAGMEAPTPPLNSEPKLPTRASPQLVAAQFERTLEEENQTEETEQEPQ